MVGCVEWSTEDDEVETYGTSVSSRRQQYTVYTVPYHQHSTVQSTYDILIRVWRVQIRIERVSRREHSSVLALFSQSC